jgi:bifunctional N-acetylglucosamine-1-phosphate-uridyltransferase/glucosamine-1-phosphate-acetyltransferase GlmU-like protein
VTICRVSDYVNSIGASPLAALAAESPWALTTALPELLAGWMEAPPPDYSVLDGVAVHRTARIEPGAVVKGPVVLSAGAFVAAHAYLRGGVFLGEGCVAGPSVELKTCAMFARSKVAHLGFVGDSVLGEAVNCEAGVVLANHWNERTDRRIRVRVGEHVVDTGVDKFGALVGDGACIGANAVLAPGTILPARTIVRRLALVDQSP